MPAAELEKVVVDQVRCIAHDTKLRSEVLKQISAHIESEIAELQLTRRNLNRELTRNHAEIRKLAVEVPASGTTTSRIADLHERVAKAETHRAELAEQIKELEHERLDKNDVALAFASFDNVWNVLSPREQAQVIALLVSRVEFNAKDSTVAVTFHSSAIKTLSRKQLEEAA